MMYFGNKIKSEKLQLKHSVNTGLKCSIPVLTARHRKFIYGRFVATCNFLASFFFIKVAMLSSNTQFGEIGKNY